MTCSFCLSSPAPLPHLRITVTDLTTRPCGICGEPVQYANSPSLGFHLVQYHDCKPVPGARLDEAKAEIAALTAKREELLTQLAAATGREAASSALLRNTLRDNEVQKARLVLVDSRVTFLQEALATAERSTATANQTVDSLISPDGRNYLTKVESERNQARAEKDTAIALLREGLDTGRHCCADRADCPRCAWEEKVHTLLDSNARLKPVVRSLRVVLPVNAQKRYLRPHSNAEWFESDDPNGPWTLVPVQA